MQADGLLQFRNRVDRTTVNLHHHVAFLNTSGGSGATFRKVTDIHTFVYLYAILFGLAAIQLIQSNTQVPPLYVAVLNEVA